MLSTLGSVSAQNENDIYLFKDGKKDDLLSCGHPIEGNKIVVNMPPGARYTSIQTKELSTYKYKWIEITWKYWSNYDDYPPVQVSNIVFMSGMTKYVNQYAINTSKTYETKILSLNNQRFIDGIIIQFVNGYDYDYRRYPSDYSYKIYISEIKLVARE